MTKAQTATLLAVAALALAGCSGSEAKKPSAHESLDVGARVPFSIWTHCGVAHTTIDGVTWQTHAGGDAQGTDHPDCPEYIDGILTRLSEERAVFRGKTIPIRLVYERAPNAVYYCSRRPGHPLIGTIRSACPDDIPYWAAA